MLINTIYPGYVSSYGNGYACQSLLEAISAADIDVRLFCVSADKSIRKPFYRCAMPTWATALGYRLTTQSLRVKYTEWIFQHAFNDQDIAYIWPGTSNRTYEKIKSAGHILITENINTHLATSKAILDTEYQRLGLNADQRIDEKKIFDENSRLSLIDFVFSPSEEVSKSLLKAGVASKKIIRTSYGIDSSDILSPEIVDLRTQEHELTAIFVGRIGIRKGAHLLLKYWVNAKVNGKLKLIGNIDHDARQLIEPYLRYPNIEHIPFTTNLRSLYLNADMLLFPSLEEGSPLVTYLALGAGLPSIVSPMGSGGVINDGFEGLVVDSHNEEGWIDSIRKIFFDTELRMKLSKNASKKAEEYLWSNVGRFRRESLLASLNY